MRMEKKLIYLLEEFKNDIAAKQEEIKRMEEEPLTFFTSLINKRSGIIPMVLAERGEEGLLDYQSYFYPKILAALKEKFSIDEFLLSYDKTYFPSPIYWSYDGRVAAELHPYEKTFLIPMPEVMKETLTKKDELTKDAKIVEEELEVRKVEEANPMLLGGGNLFKLMHIAMKRKKTTDGIRKKAREQLDELSEIRKQKIQVDVTLDRLNMEQLHLSLALERVAKRLNQQYGIVVTNETDVNDVEEQLTENSEKPYEYGEKSIEDLLMEQKDADKLLNVSK